MKLVIMTPIVMLAASLAYSQPNAVTNSSSNLANMATNPMPPPAERTSPATQNPSTMDPSSATGTGAKAADGMTEQAAPHQLSGAGWGSVSSLKRNANGDWEAMTKKGSKQQRVTFANDGTVSPLAPM